MSGIFSVSSPLALGLSVAFAAIVAVAPKLSDWFKNLTGDLEYLNEKLEEAENELQNCQNELNELKGIPWYDRTPEIEKEIRKLEEENEELKKNVDYWEDRKKQSEEDKEKDTRSFSENYQLTGTYEFAGETYYAESGVFATYEEALADFAAITLQTTEEVENQLGKNVDLVVGSVEDTVAKSTNLMERYLSLYNNYLEGNISGEEFYDRLNDINYEYQDIIDILEIKLQKNLKLTESETALANAFALVNSALRIEVNKVEQSVEAGQDLLTQEEQSLKVVNKLNTAYGAHNATLTISIDEYKQLREEGMAAYYSTNELTSALDIQVSSLIDAARAGSEYAKSLILIARSQSIKNIRDLTESLADVKPVFDEDGRLSAINSSEYKGILSKIQEEKEFLGSLAGAYTIEGMNIDVVRKEGSSGAIAETAEEDAEDYLEALENYLEAKEHDIFLLSKEDEEKNSQEIIDTYREMQNQVHKRADEIRAMNLEDKELEAELLRELQKLWWEYEDNINEILDDRHQKVIENIENEISVLNEEASIYESLSSYMVDFINKKIDALDEENDKLNTQIELEEKLDKIAKARQKRVLVYKDGRFQYIEDTDEVSAAESEYEQWKQEQVFEQQKEELQDLADSWSDFASDYEKTQDKIIIEQKLGIKLTEENMERMLNSADSWKDKYIDILEEIANKQSELNNLQKEEVYVPSTGKEWQVDPSGNAPAGAGIGDIVHTAGGDYQIVPSDTPGASYNPESGHWSVKVDGYASGTTNAKGGLSLVGENGPELRILNSGDSILPNDLTHNLINWGKLPVENVFSKIKNSENVIHFTIENLNLSNVKDGNDFINYLNSNIWRKALQFSN